MQDHFGREITYLRISVTDRCNLRCLYCMPEEGVPFLPHGDILTYEEIIRVVDAARDLGLRRIRLTGGEPLVRRDIITLVQGLAALPGIEDLAMTTNATLLAEKAAELKEAGLRRVNISLDSLRPERYREITRGGDLKRVLAGIDTAIQVGLVPVKINVVVIRGFNDDELPDLVKFAMEKNLNLRFIELMSIGESSRWPHRGYIPSAELKKKLEESTGLPLEIMEKGGLTGTGPAEYYRLPGGRGTVGFISPVSDHFCRFCNRLRLTATGALRPCLLSEREIDIRTPLRQGIDREGLKELIRSAVWAKPEKQEIPQQPGATQLPHRYMSQIGG